MTIEEEFEEKFTIEGIDAAINHYKDLKKRYYTKGAYDFSESTLNLLGYGFLRNSALKAAISIFKLNAEQFPESANAWDSLAEAQMNSGDSKNAITNYQKSLKLNPDNQNAKDMLNKLIK